MSWWDNIIQVRGQQQFCFTRERICCPKLQADLLKTFIIFKIVCYSIHSHVHLFIHVCLKISHDGIYSTVQESGRRHFCSLRYCNNHSWCHDHVTCWTYEPMKIRPSVNSLIAGNISMNCWPVNRIMLQRVGIFLWTVQMLCIYWIDFIKEKRCV